MKKLLITEEQYNRIFLLEQVGSQAAAQLGGIVKNPTSSKSNSDSSLPGANAGEIQQFLIDKGVLPRINPKTKKPNKDWDFGDGTAEAFAKYYGFTNINTSQQLWKKLKEAGHNVGNNSKFGPLLAQVLTDLIKKREGELPGLKTIYFYDEDVNAQKIDRYENWGFDDSWEYWVKKNGGMQKHLSGLRRSFNGAPDKPGFTKILWSSDYTQSSDPNTIKANGEKTPIIWVYKSNEDIEEEEKENKKEQERNQYQIDRKNIQNEWTEPLDKGYNKNWGVNKLSYPGKHNTSKPTLSVTNTSDNKKTDVAKYITNFNKVSGHWLKLNKKFKWFNEGITNLNDKWLSSHPISWEGADNKYDFPDFEQYLEGHKTELISPEWLVSKVWKLNTEGGQFDMGMRNIWEMKYKVGKGYKKDSVLISKDIKPGKSQGINEWAWNKHIGGWVHPAYYDYPRENIGDPRFIYGYGEGIKDKQIIKEILDNRKLTTRQGGMMTGVEEMMTGLIGLLDFIDEWNNRYWTQELSDYDLCTDHKVYETGPIGALYGPSEFKSATWSQFCRSGNYGGNWIYNAGAGTDHKGKLRDKDDFGNKKFIRGCGCVDTPDETVTVLGKSIMFTSFSYNAFERVSQTLQDRRDWEYKTYDIGKKCATDWHCWVDIASIAALMFACVYTAGGACVVSGLAGATILEIGSGAGYVFEGLVLGQKGWQLNAALQLFSVATLGLGKGIKWGKNLYKYSKYSKLYTKALTNVNKIRKAKYADSVWQGMNQVQKNKIIKELFEESLAGLTHQEIKTLNKLNKEAAELMGDADYIKIVKSMEGMSADDIGEFKKLVAAATENAAVGKYVRESIKEGLTMKEIIADYTKYVAGDLVNPAIQLSLMGIMYGYDEETAAAVMGGLKTFEELTEKMGQKVPIRWLLGVSEDDDQDDAETMSLKNNMKQFANYSVIITEIFNYIEENIDTYLLKYGVNPEKEFKEIIVDGYDSIIGEPLETVLNRLKVITNLIKKWEEEDKDPEEIKTDLEELINIEIKWLEDEGKKENTVKEIKKAHDKNKPSPELEKTLEGVDWGNYGVEDIDK